MGKAKLKKSLSRAYDNLPVSIINTAKAYPQGRDLLIGCLMRETNRKAIEVIGFLESHNKGICDLREYRIRDKNRNK